MMKKHCRVNTRLGGDGNGNDSNSLLLHRGARSNVTYAFNHCCCCVYQYPLHVSKLKINRLLPSLQYIFFMLKSNQYYLEGYVMAQTLMLTMNWFRSDASSLCDLQNWSRCSIFNYSSMDCQGSSYISVCYTKCVRKNTMYSVWMIFITTVSFSSSSIPLCLHLFLCDRYKFNEGNP